MPQIITLIGATGLIGQHVLEILQEHPQVEHIKLLLRREVSFTHPKVANHIIAFENIEAMQEVINGSDAVLCAVGTTTKKVNGDKDAYRKVDYDIPVHAAQCCQKAGVPHFGVVSSVGAKAKSNNFYLQLKGEMEEAVKALHLPSTAVYQPSMLLGDRKEKRVGEKIGQIMMQAVKFLIPKKYKPIHAKDVARAMVNVSLVSPPGYKVRQNAAIWDNQKSQ